MKHVPHYLTRIALIQSLFLLSVSPWLGGCSSHPATSGKNSFTNLIAGITPSAEISDPTLYVFNSIKQAQQVAGWLETDPASTLLRADYKNNVVVVAFWGPKPSTGYMIAIQNLVISGTDIRLAAKLTSPALDSPQSMVVIYPYHAITVPRDAFPQLSGTTWSLYDTEDNLIAQTMIP